MLPMMRVFVYIKVWRRGVSLSRLLSCPWGCRRAEKQMASTTTSESEKYVAVVERSSHCTRGRRGATSSLLRSLFPSSTTYNVVLVGRLSPFHFFFAVAIKSPLCEYRYDCNARRRYLLGARTSGTIVGGGGAIGARAHLYIRPRVAIAA